MAFQFTDTFCTIASAAQSPYELVSGSPTYSSAYARFAAPSGCQAGGVSLLGAQAIRKNLNGNQTTLIAFCSYGAQALPSTGNSAIISFWDAGTTQSYLGLTSTGALQFYRGGSGGTAIGPASAPSIIGLSTAPTHGIEIVITFSATVGQVQCWLDGKQIINSAASLNTIQTVNAYANQVQLGAVGSGCNMYTDYFRVWDNTGATQNAPIGLDRQPVTKLPSSAGTNTNWVANGLGSNYLCVGVIPPNTSDYVSANGTGIIDDYVMPVASLVSAPSQVVATSYYEKDDSATRTYTNGVLSSGTSGVGSTFTANSGYTWVQSCIALDPHTGVAWTAAGADAAHFLHEELS